MSPEMITAIVTGICTIIASIGALIVSLRTSQKAVLAEENAKAAANNLKTDIKEVHVLVNSNMTKALDEITKYTAVIAELRGDPADIKNAERAAERKPTS